MDKREKISEKLNELLIKNYDAEKGYLNASNNIENEGLKMFFNKRANERSKFTTELRTEILRNSSTFEDSASASGKLRGNWMTKKVLFSTKNDEAILEEAIEGEKSSLEKYIDILSNTNLPSRINAILLRQRNAIEAAIHTQKIHKKIIS